MTTEFIFQEKEYKHFFPVRSANHWYAKKYGLTHEILIGNGTWDNTITRFAIVKKTVAYVAVDENEDGSPIFEKWQIKTW